jgi:hypothetical protein
VGRTHVVTGNVSAMGAATRRFLKSNCAKVIGGNRHDAEVVADSATAESRAAMVEGVREASGGALEGVRHGAGDLRRRRLGLAVAAVLVVALVLTSAAAWAAASWVRHDDHWFVWYAPDATWVHDESANGIDITSATGVLSVGFGFSGWTSPLTINDVAGYWIRAGALDAHPLQGIRIVSAGRPYKNGPALRQEFEWTGIRTDRNESVRGVFSVDVYNDAALGSYGFDVYTRTAPTGVYAQWSATLAQIQHLIFFKPRSPYGNVVGITGNVVGIRPCRHSVRPCKR